MTRPMEVPAEADTEQDTVHIRCMLCRFTDPMRSMCGQDLDAEGERGLEEPVSCGLCEVLKTAHFELLHPAAVARQRRRL